MIHMKRTQLSILNGVPTWQFLCSLKILPIVELLSQIEIFSLHTGNSARKNILNKDIEVEINQLSE